MSPSPLTLVASITTSDLGGSASREHEQQVAKLTKALYPADRQEKFLELQAEVETLLCQLQALQRVHG
ncbi:hypothetical protein [Chamaesiphon sp.]|uniref:hypothetical protein n=1 Tax=Chamaesiphon sp. TaxID=2814140 RepID=UPI003593995F